MEILGIRMPVMCNNVKIRITRFNTSKGWSVRDIDARQTKLRATLHVPVYSTGVIPLSYMEVEEFLYNDELLSYWDGRDVAPGGPVFVSSLTKS